MTWLDEWRRPSGGVEDRNQGSAAVSITARLWRRPSGGVEDRNVDAYRASMASD